MRFYPGSVMTLSTTVLVDGVLTDAPAMTFEYKITEYGDETLVTPTHQSTGIYSATVTLPEAQSGTMYYQWNTNSPLGIVEQGKINIARSAFT